jgi:hypothetical protein
MSIVFLSPLTRLLTHLSTIHEMRTKSEKADFDLRVTLAKKKQGWERRERRKRDKPQPCKKLFKVYVRMTIKKR